MKKNILMAAILAASTTAVFANTTAVEAANSVESTNNQKNTFAECLSFEVLHKGYRLYTPYEIDNMSSEDAKLALMEYLPVVANVKENYAKDMSDPESARNYFIRIFNTAFFGSEQEYKDLLMEYYNLVLENN